MRAVSDAFKLALARHRGEGTREVAYKRRKWDAATLAYVWEDDWTALSEGEVSSVSAITSQLDTEQLTEFKVSNVTVVLKNQDNRWREDNPSGIFGQDDGSPLYPYNPYFTKFRVRVAVRLADGTDEFVTMFTGLAAEFTYASNDQVQITVNGLEGLLANTNAEDVSTTVTNENAGTGNGVTTAFTTVHPGVGIIDEVSLNGVEQQAGTAYQVADLDEPTTGATVTFAAAPSGGVVVRISYRYWQQNKRIEQLVESLLSAAGIAGADQQVDPVIFSNPILNAVTVDSQADWQAGTPTSLDLTSEPGSVKIDVTDSANYRLLDDFSDGNFTANPVWGFGGNLAWSVTGNKLRYVKSGVTVKGIAYTSAAVAQTNGPQMGVWQFLWTTPSPIADRLNFGFIANGFQSDAAFPFYQYGFTGDRVEWRADSSGVQTWSLYLNDTLVATSAFSITAGDHTVRMVRYPGGLYRFTIDGNLILQGNSTALVAALYFGIGSGFGPFSSTQDFDNFYVPQETFTGQWLSPTYDLTAGVQILGRLTADFSNVDGTLTFYTRTSTDGVTWDAWTQISANGQVNSDVHRYLQVKIVLSQSSGDIHEIVLRSFRVEYQTVVANITLAKFTGKTVYEAIQTLGQFSNYEWGFDAEETFFFRAKRATQTAVETLGRADVQAVTQLTTGYDRTYSEVRVTYGSFQSVLRAPNVDPQDAKARFGVKVFEVSVGDIVIGNDADIASGVAKLFFADLRRPKRRLKAVCRFLPYLDLSDVLLLGFAQNRPRKAWHLGDETVSLGDRDTSLWGDRQQLLEGMYVKVVGARHTVDPKQYTTEFDLEEVL